MEGARVFTRILPQGLRNYHIDESRNLLIAKAFIGVDGADTVRYDGRRVRRDEEARTDVKHTQVDLGDFAVYTTKYGIGITYEVNENFINKLKVAALHHNGLLLSRHSLTSISFYDARIQFLTEK